MAFWQYKRGTDPHGQKLSRRTDTAGTTVPEGYQPAPVGYEQMPYQPWYVNPNTEGVYGGPWQPGNGASVGDWLKWGGNEGFVTRLDRPFYPNVDMLAGLRSVDGANPNATQVLLPPLEPFRRAATTRSFAGGPNRAGGGSREMGLAYIPAVFVPIGRV